MQPGDWADLPTLRGPALLDRLARNVDLIVDSARAAGQDEDAILSALPESLRVLWLTERLDFEVTQGSLLAYFMNSSARHAPDAAAALRRIGAEGMAGVLEDAMSVVGRHRDSWLQRRAELDDAPEFGVVHPYRELAGADELDALTDAYWNAADREAWGEKLERYLDGQRAAVADWAAA
jgi:hypothetical protein